MKTLSLLAVIALAEFVGTFNPADFDHDGDVDLADFSAFQACYNGPNRPPAEWCPLPEYYPGGVVIDVGDRQVIRAWATVRGDGKYSIAWSCCPDGAVEFSNPFGAETTITPMVEGVVTIRVTAFVEQ